MVVKLVFTALMLAVSIPADASVNRELLIQLEQSTQGLLDFYEVAEITEFSTDCTELCDTTEAFAEQVQAYALPLRNQSVAELVGVLDALENSPALSGCKDCDERLLPIIMNLLELDVRWNVRDLLFRHLWNRVSRESLFAYGDRIRDVVIRNPTSEGVLLFGYVGSVDPETFKAEIGDIETSIESFKDVVDFVPASNDAVLAAKARNGCVVSEKRLQDRIDSGYMQSIVYAAYVNTRSMQVYLANNLRSAELWIGDGKRTIWSKRHFCAVALVRMLGDKEGFPVRNDFSDVDGDYIKLERWAESELGVEFSGDRPSIDNMRGEMFRRVRDRGQEDGLKE